MEADAKNQIGQAALGQIAYQLGRYFGVQTLRIEGGRRTTGRYKGQLPTPFYITIHLLTSMATVILAGWRDGLRVLPLVRPQQNLLQLSLKEAKENVDRLLEAEENVLQFGRPVVLQVPDSVLASFAQQADSLGALVGVIKMGAPGEAEAAHRQDNSQQAA